MPRAPFSAAAGPRAFIWQQDRETGLMVAQIDVDDGRDNYSGYYTYEFTSKTERRYLIYRSAGLGWTHFYRLCLETGARELIAGNDEIQAVAEVFQNDLYAYTRISGIYRLSRYSIRPPFTRTDLYDLPTNIAAFSFCSVNCDGTKLLYTLRLSGSANMGLYYYDIPGDYANQIATDVGTQTHFVFSPTEPDLYTFMDTAASRLNLIGLGRTDSPYRKVKLTSTDAYLVSTVSNYPHPWWDVAGRLWSDTLIGQDPDAWLRLNLSTVNDANFGRVLAYDFTALDNIEFQHHQRRMNATHYFAGDGRVNDLPQGESYIHLMKAVPGAAVEQYRLAKAVGTEDLNNTGYPANARMTETLDGMLWSAYDAFPGGGSSNNLHLFMVRLPNTLKALLAANKTGPYEHPFKHGNRVTVTGGSIWCMDYSSRTNWGDAVTDNSGTWSPWGGLATHFDMADINGDDVDDRLAMLWSGENGGTWHIACSFSTYGGTFGSGLSDREAAYAGCTSNYPPVFEDVDGNGMDDTVLIRKNVNCYWSAYLNTTGGFNSVVSPAHDSNGFGGSNEAYCLVADVNRDGRADRIVVRPSDSGWEWIARYSTPTDWGDDVNDTSQRGGENSIDTPGVEDVNGDGYADLLVFRRQGGALAWIGRTSSSGGFGLEWDWTEHRYGTAPDRPVIGHQQHFTTSAAEAAASRINAGDGTLFSLR